MSSSNSKTLRRDLNSILEHSKLSSAEEMSTLDLGLEGGARKKAPKKKSAKKTSAKKTSAKPAKKTSAKKTSAKKTSAKKTSAKKTSAKKTSAKKTSAKKTSAKKMSRELPEGMKAHLSFVSFLLKDMGVSGGPPIQVVAKMYKDIAREKNPDADSVELAKLAQKVYTDEKSKSPKKPLERLETAKKQIIAKKATKKASKKA